MVESTTLVLTNTEQAFPSAGRVRRRRDRNRTAPEQAIVSNRAPNSGLIGTWSLLDQPAYGQKNGREPAFGPRALPCLDPWLCGGAGVRFCSDEPGGRRRAAELSTVAVVTVPFA
jgi:hypothetical protein